MPRARRGVIAGLRPERFEDVAVAGDRSPGVTLKAKIEALESAESEYYRPIPAVQPRTAGVQRDPSG